MIPGEPVVITTITWGAMGPVPWLDSGGRKLSITETLTFHSGSSRGTSQP